MKKASNFLIFVFLIPYAVWSQCPPIVPNGSFEEFSSLPNDDCDWELAIGWNNAALSTLCTPDNGTPDYYHTAGVGPFSSLPDNFFASVLPIDGEAVMGVGGRINIDPNGREYMAINLTSPLVVGQDYTLQYSITPGTPLVGGFYVDGWGAALTVGTLLQPPGNNGLINIPDDQFIATGVINFTSWSSASFTFTADQPFDYITLGNFFGDAEQNVQTYGVQDLISIAYCFFDDISIVPLSFDPPITIDLTDQEICIDENAEILASVGGGAPPYTYVWNPNLGTGPGPFDVNPTANTTYTLTVTDCNGNQATENAVITVTDENLSVNLGADQDLCNGDIVLNATTAGALSYQWNTGAITATIVVGEPGVYSVSVTGTCENASDDIVIAPCILPLEVSLGENQAICPDYVVALLAEASGGLPPYNYSWTPNLGSSAGPFSVSPSGTSNYGVTVTDAEGSSATALVQIQVIEENLFVNLGPDLNFCGGNINLDASTPGAQSYQWNTGDTTSQILIRLPGNYTVSVSGLCSSVSDTIAIRDAFTPLPSFAEIVRFCSGDTALIGPEVLPEFAIIWNDGSNISPRAITQEGTYAATFFDICGARNLLIETTAFNCECDVYVPNSFTPNGDGINDLFGPAINCDVDEFTFYIVNRWGEEVWRTNNPNEKWNGGDMGSDYFASNTMYYWRLVLQPVNTFEVRPTRDLQGFVVLIR